MKNRVVSLHYTLKDKSGNLLDSSRQGEPLSFMEGVGQIIPGLEKGIKGLKIGDTKNVVVAADEAYGERDDRFVMTVAREELPQGEIKVGQQYEIKSDKGEQVVTVTNITGAQVTLDGNHPLAGQDLHFDVEITGVREATEEEINHGHIHT